MFRMRGSDFRYLGQGKLTHEQIEKGDKMIADFEAKFLLVKPTDGKRVGKSLTEEKRKELCKQFEE